MPFTECVYYPSSDTKTKKKKNENLRRCCCTEEFNVIQCKSISQGHPSKNTQSTHITHVYIHLCIQINMSSKKKCEWLKVCNKMQVFQSSWIFLVVLIQVVILFPLAVELWILQKQTVRDDHVKSNVKSNTVINHLFCVILSNDVKTYWHFFIVLFSSQPIQSRSW